MTGPRRVRGRVGEDRVPRHDPAPPLQRAELEELGIRPVHGRGPTRVGKPAVLAGLGVAVLLAAGLGALGGRLPASAPPAVAIASGATPTPAAAAPSVARTPRVTPAEPCGSLPIDGPPIELVVDGDRFAGSSVAEFNGSIRVPADARTQLAVVGGACANAWTIELEDGILDALYNPELDAAYASQNRFDLDLYGFRGGQYGLVATLKFPGREARAFWQIDVSDFVRPDGTLIGRSGTIEMTGGCDVVLRLRNGTVDGRWMSDCDPPSIPLGEILPEPAAVAPGEELAFRMGDWDIDTAHVACGRLEIHTFGGPDPACRMSGGNFIGTVIFDGPAAPGRWTLAVDVCARQDRDADRSNSLCGTWYAIVEVST